MNTPTHLRLAAQSLADRAAHIRREAQYTDSSQARTAAEDNARQLSNEAGYLNDGAAAMEKLDQVRAALDKHATSTHISKQDVIDQIAALVK